MSYLTNPYRYGIPTEEIVLDDDPSSPYAWCNGTVEGGSDNCYAPTMPTPSNQNNYNGVFINTGSALLGKTVLKITFFLCKFGSPNTSGTIRLGIMSDTTGGNNIDWIAGSYVDITDNLGVLNAGYPAVPYPYTITLPTPHTLAVGDTMALGLTGGNYDESNNVAWQYTAGTNIYDAEKTARNRFSNGSWTGAGMTSDMRCTIEVEL